MTAPVPEGKITFCSYWSDGTNFRSSFQLKLPFAHTHSLSMLLDLETSTGRGRKCVHIMLPLDTAVRLRSDHVRLNSSTNCLLLSISQNKVAQSAVYFVFHDFFLNQHILRNARAARHYLIECPIKLAYPAGFLSITACPGPLHLSVSESLHPIAYLCARTLLPPQDLEQLRKSINSEARLMRFPKRYDIASFHPP
jgi:hypothetical protein